MAKEINEQLDMLLKIKELLRSLESDSSPVTNKEETLEISLEELRIIYSRLDNSMHTTRLRSLTFLGAALALLSYLYGGAELFIPQEPYGRVFYFLGLGLVIAAVSFLLHAVRPNPWAVPIETKLTKLGRYRTKVELLEEIVEQYIESMVANIGKYEKKCQLYSSGFGLLLCGGILLLVIKNIGG